MTLPHKTNYQPASIKTNNTTTIIAQNTTIEGSLIANHEITIHGAIKGDLTARKITMEKSATCIGAIHSEHVKIAGDFNGKINSKKVEILASAKIKGIIQQKLISIEAGAILDAKIKSQHR